MFSNNNAEEKYIDEIAKNCVNCAGNSGVPEFYNKNNDIDLDKYKTRLKELPSNILIQLSNESINPDNLALALSDQTQQNCGLLKELIRKTEVAKEEYLATKEPNQEKTDFFDAIKKIMSEITLEDLSKPDLTKTIKNKIDTQTGKNAIQFLGVKRHRIDLRKTDSLRLFESIFKEDNQAKKPRKT